jgi:hypothetical protein
MTSLRAPTFPRQWWVLGAAAIVATAAFAWSRVGLFALPSIPGDLTLLAGGLAGLDEMRRLDACLWAVGQSRPTGVDDRTWAAASRVRQGIADVRSGKPEAGLAEIRAGVEARPDSLVLANAYRLVVFRLQRDYLAAARQGGHPVTDFPAWLSGQPLRFLEDLVRRHPSRESRLSLALAWVDLMLLFPALEIKAPASVEAVRILNPVVESTDPYYVPALFARGLNHLHRPARLVWPEADKTPPDAAVQDIARCVAVGRRFAVGSDRLQATLAIALGDAYVKAGEAGRARSWWQIAQNLCREAAVQQAVRRRYAWRDEEILDRLEEELDGARARLDDPMTNLQLMWN